MKPSLLTLAITFCCCTLFAQNENPYAQFGYQAAIMPEQSKPKMEHQVDRLYIINQDSTDAVAIVALDATNRNITFYDKNRQVLNVDTLTNYTLARWISPDPYGQFSSPYLSMGNNPVSGVDPDGGWLSPFNFKGAAIGLAVGAGIGLAFDKDNWGWYALGGAGAGGFLSSDLAKVNIWHSHGYNGLVAAKNGREGIRFMPKSIESSGGNYFRSKLLKNMQVLVTNAILQAAKDEFFPKDSPISFDEASKNTVWHLDKANKYTNGSTLGHIPPTKDRLKDNLDVYINPQAFKTSHKLKFAAQVIGHEWIHVIHFRSGAFSNWVKASNVHNAEMISEYKAWDWNAHMDPENELNTDANHHRNDYYKNISPKSQQTLNPNVYK